MICADLHISLSDMFISLSFMEPLSKQRMTKTLQYANDNMLIKDSASLVAHCRERTRVEIDG